MRVITGGDRNDGSVEIFDDRTFQVLRLKTFTAPASSRCAVIAEGAADAVVLTGTGKQCVNLFHRRLRAAEPELEHALHRRRQFLCSLQLPLDRGLVKLLKGTAVLLQPRQQLRDLVDLSDSAASELGELGIDLRRRRLRNPASSFGKGTINAETACVDGGAHHPDRLFRRR